MKRSIYVGYDPRETAAFAVAKHSLRRRMSGDIPVIGLSLADLERQGLHARPMRRDLKGRLVDSLSVRPDYDGAISTEHANARFFVPLVASEGWAMFCDGDILVRSDISEIFDALDPAYAVYCVHHDYRPAETVKMDGQAQTQYGRKNWSSVMIFNCEHVANREGLSLGMLNSLPGRDLHAFCWLSSHQIGELDPAWNWLVGHSDQAIDPKLVHFTTGVPDMPGYESVAYSDEWRSELEDWTVRG